MRFKDFAEKFPAEVKDLPLVAENENGEMSKADILEIHNDCVTYGYELRRDDYWEHERFYTIRIYRLNNRIYWDRMCNGDVLDCELITELD